jgi:cytochrome o ubiquinol oxidase subunit 1
MFGRLTFDDLPLYGPLALTGAVFEVIVGALIVASLLWYGKLGYLWRDWLTSLDHNRIGVKARSGETN